MPSFDIVSEVDKQELDNAINQARKELATRFDFKGSSASVELEPKENRIKLTAEDASRLKSLSEIVIGKIAKRNIDLRNIERKDPAISPLGHATQEFKIQQGLEGEKAKEIIKAIKAAEFKVQKRLAGTPDSCDRQKIAMISNRSLRSAAAKTSASASLSRTSAIRAITPAYS